jgi:hypothetical protein
MENLNLIKKRDALAKDLLKNANLFRGSMCEVNRTCGTKGCHCHTGGKKHPGFQLTFKKEGNITKTVYISKDNVKKIKEGLENYQKLLDKIEQIIQINLELLKKNPT